MTVSTAVQIQVSFYSYMGVHGLTSFIDAFFKDWERREVQGRIVVDGNSLCHKLYQADWTHGGQYPEYQNAVLQFFRTLQHADIFPVVVFDGVDYKQEKTKEIIRRRREWIKLIHSVLSGPKYGHKGLILPALAVMVFQQTLCELKVPIHVVDGDADAVIVQIANHYSCPVLSSDSDFFIFNVECGYIPMDRFHWNSTPVTAEVFNVRSFTLQFKFSDENLRFIIPAILGNDFLTPVDSSNFMHYIRTKVVAGNNKTMAVVCYASQFESMQNFVDQINSIPLKVDQRGLENNCKKAQKMYLLQRVTNPDELKLSTELRQVDGDCIPDWLLQQYRLANIPLSIMEAVVLGKCFLRIVVDNSRLSSSLMVSKPLRQYMYKLLRVSPVAETFRCGLDLGQEKVDAMDTTDDLKLPEAKNIPKLNLPDRKHLFFTALCCNDRLVEELDESWQLVAASLVYWARNACVPLHLVKALIMCLVFCSTYTAELPRLRKEAVIPSEFRRSSKWMVALHSFAQWQCVYFDSVSLCQLLMKPLDVISPALLYDGKIAFHLASAQNVDQKACTASIDHTLYERLLGVVLFHLQHYSVEKSVDEQIKEKQPNSSIRSHQKKEKGKEKTTVKSRFEHHNPFALLGDSDTDSSESN